MLFVSTRYLFRAGDPGWDRYINWIALPQLRQVCTVDAALNGYVDRCGSIHCDRSDVEGALGALPEPKGDREYHLLGRTVESPSWAETFDGFDFLGCDLSDETMTSSLLNCGPWTGALQPLTTRLNAFGLLSVDDALRAQNLLPGEWGAQEHHALASVWALFGRGLALRVLDGQETSWRVRHQHTGEGLLNQQDLARPAEAAGGLSADECRWAGCHERALKGKPLCVIHANRSSL